MNLKAFAAHIGINYQRFQNVLTGSDTSSVLRGKIETALGESFWPAPTSTNRDHQTKPAHV
jgi:hypothetical protein